MFLRFFGLFDNTAETRQKFIGVLAEQLSTRRLALENASDDGDRRRLRASIMGIEKELRMARGEPDAGPASRVIEKLLRQNAP